MSEGKSPYSDLPDHCFWRRVHQGVEPELIDPMVSAPFKILPESRIATAGSCFAQHLARHLRKSGYNHFVTEAAHPLIRPSVAEEMGYGIYSARYGNIYTPRQLLQLVQRMDGDLAPAEDVWSFKGGIVDPFRPTIQPGGFVSESEMKTDRTQHFRAVRRMIEECDVFIFTFGLTEAWRSKRDGAVYPVCPGVAGGQFDENAHEFVNFEVDEIVGDFEAFLDCLWARNPEANVLMTVSPVPLVATAREDTNVIAATTYSKAVLRVACDVLARRHPKAHYFPSYEVVTGNFNRGRYYRQDLREVHPDGVRHVMRLFMDHFAVAIDQATKAIGPEVSEAAAPDAHTAEMAEKMDVVCDEILLDDS